MKKLIELRIKIWAYACLPRIVDLYHKPRDRRTPLQKALRLKKAPTGPLSGGQGMRNPALLSVNQEARYEALRFWELVYISNLPTYINYEFDTLFFGDTTELFITLNKQIIALPNQWIPTQSIQHLIVYLGPHSISTEADDIEMLQVWYPALKTITIWRDRRKINGNGSNGSWTEGAWVGNPSPKSNWFTIPREERFVPPITELEQQYAATELARLMRHFDWRRFRTNLQWPLEEVSIVYMNPKIKYNNWKWQWRWMVFQSYLTVAFALSWNQWKCIIIIVFMVCLCIFGIMMYLMGGHYVKTKV